ncbi:MAG: glycosyltransferase family 4 protein [Gammaproteobacteria bacterium]|nr:glycosyltransferase family 4 protein [Gammaproteobacteria bacterium]
MAGVKPSLLFLVTEDWYFMSHRAELARAAVEAGFDVSLVTQVSRHEAEIRDMGIALYPVVFPRSFRRPWQDIRTLTGTCKALRAASPDIVHHVSLKPIVIGSLLHKTGPCAGNKPAVINAFTGLGYVFTSQKFSARMIRAILVPLLKSLLRGRNHFLLFQNRDDMRMMIDQGIARENQCTLIPGSGVNVHKYSPTEEPEGPPVCTLVSRMLYDKGVQDFVEAARLVKEQGVNARFVLVGDTDPENPAGIPEHVLQSWHRDGNIEYLGRQQDVSDVYANSHIVVLPSHREGFPKTVIEAAACARPVITTDVPGCRDAIVPGETGKLVPAKDPGALAAAMIELINDKQQRERLGRAGRSLVEEKYASGVINSQFIKLYRKIINKEPEEK